jgi:hypothetical protein
VPATLIHAEPEPIAVDLDRMIAEAYPDFSLRGAAKLNIHSSSSRRREIVSVTAKFAIASRGKMRHVKYTARGSLSDRPPGKRASGVALQESLRYFRRSHAHA